MDCQLIVFSTFLAIVQADSLGSFGVGTQTAGGQDAKKGAITYLVSLSWDATPVAKFNDICSGAFLNKSRISTTANCLYLKPVYGTLTVKAGEHRFAKPVPKEQVAVVEKRENFVMQSASNNIAPLKLKKPLKLSANVAAIKLPQADGAVTDNLTVAGWGTAPVTEELAYPNVLQKLNSTLHNIRDWQKTFEAIAENVAVSLENKFGTASPPAKAICIGDTGVPLISRVPGKPRNVGELIRGHCILILLWLCLR